MVARFTTATLVLKADKIFINVGGRETYACERDSVRVDSSVEHELCIVFVYCSSGGLEKHVGRNRLARALAISPHARGRNQQVADTTISPAIIRPVSCSALAPARLIAIPSSTPGKTWAGAQASAEENRPVVSLSKPER